MEYLYVVVIEHPDDAEIGLFRSVRNAFQFVADYARTNWEHRADKDAPDDPTGFTDELVVDTYFTEHPNESYYVVHRGVQP